MKIIGLKVDGFRKLKAVEVNFAQDGITTIIGDNEQGKTTVLDTIEYLIKGKTMLNEDIIQHGKKELTAELSLGKYSIKRKSDKKGKDYLRITTNEGEEVKKKKQSFLNEMINDLTFNPFPFLLKSGDEKLKFMFDFLKIDTKTFDKKLKDLENDRLICGREGKKIGKIEQVEKAEYKDIKEILKEKERLEIKNKEAERKAIEQKEVLLQKALDFNKKQDDIELKRNINKENIKRGKEQLLKLEEEIKNINIKIKSLEKEKENLPKKEDKKSTEIEMPKYFTKDLSVFSEEINRTIENNKLADKYEEYKKNKIEIKEKRDEYNAFSKDIEKIREEKKQLLNNTETGVKDLKISEDGLYYKGIYSENWSDSQEIAISCNLCIAMNPKLKAVFIDRGESFGSKRLKALETWAKENKIQAIITKVVEEKPEDIPENTYYISNGEIII